MLDCPYCSKPNPEPDPKYIGSWFRCVHCQKKWLYAGARQAQPQTHPAPTVMPGTHQKGIRELVRTGFGIGIGFYVVALIFFLLTTGVSWLWFRSAFQAPEFDAYFGPDVEQSTPKEAKSNASLFPNNRTVKDYVGWTYQQIVQELGLPTRIEQDIVIPAAGPGDKAAHIQMIVYEDNRAYRAFNLQDGIVVGGAAAPK